MSGMHDKRAVVLVIGAGWGARTFLQTDVLDALADQAPVAVLAHPDLVAAISRRTPRLAAVAPLVPCDSRAGALGRLAYRRNRLFLERSTTTTRRANLRRTRRRGLRGRARDLLYRLEARVTGDAAVCAMIEREAAAFAAIFPDTVAAYRRFLSEHRAGLVVSTTAYLPIEAPPLRVAKDLGIATACWINSWDNPTSKGPLPIVYDEYFVWSERLARDLRRYYPETRVRPCSAVGVPHFDAYFDPVPECERADFCRRSGLDPARPIVLYAACTPFLAPHEHLVVDRLAEDLARSPLKPRPQLIVRLHPSDHGGRFASIAARDDVVVDVPGAARDDRPAGIYGFFPEPDENAHAIASVRHADAVVNIASTISLEAAVADRPTINIAYDLASGAPAEDDIREYYRYEHYRTVVEIGAARVVESPDALPDVLGESLADPRRERAARAALASLWCAPSGQSAADGRAGRRLGGALASMLASDPPGCAHGGSGR